VTKQSLSATPLLRKLMVFFTAYALLCFVLTLLMSEFFVAGIKGRSQSYANYGLLIEALVRQSDAGVDALDAISNLNVDNSIDEICLYLVGSHSLDLVANYNHAESTDSCSFQYVGQKSDYKKTIILQTGDGVKKTFQLFIVSRLLGQPSALAMNSYVWLLLGLFLFFAWCFSIFASRMMSAPFYRLLEVIKTVTGKQDYSIRADVVTDDALGVLSENFNIMIADIETRNHEVASARRELEVRVREVDISNRELSSTLQKLRATQQKLINNEKMASLGGLVAGIAHEINTPVGVGVTAASTLLESTRSVSNKYERGELTNSSLLQYIEHATSAANIILGNLERAANLIQSFKQVAVDQSNSEVRQIELKNYLGQVLTSLNPQFRKTNLRYEFECPSGLSIRSYPGALSQIVTNFVMNAIIHGYQKGDSGKISLVVSSCDPEGVCICFSDDGKGISPENIGRVWDPFFTTNRGGGGSGLGLHIVYNLVTQQLCGNIEIESSLGKGTAIRLFLPMDVGKVVSYE
jgi:signal transduction histidine kinase